MPDTTPTTYAIPKDVENFLALEGAIDANSDLGADQVNKYILQAEGEFERRSGQAYRPRWAEDEEHDLTAVTTRYPQLFEGETLSYKPIQLAHRPILPFDTNRGHMIEVYEGSSDAALDWTDWLADKTQGRGNDFWVDEQKGRLYIRKTFFIRRDALFRITYEWGRPIATLNGAVSAGSTSAITLSQSGHSKGATFGYPARGILRLGNEYIFYDGKSSTQLGTNTVARGELNTTDTAHNDGAEVYHVPDDIRELVTMRAAALFLDNEQFLAPVGEGAGAEARTDAKITRWNERWEDAFGRDFQRWTLLE